MSSEFGGFALLAVLTASIGVASVLFQVLAAMLDRPGPIRVRHWAEEAGGKLEELYAAPPKFEAFRYLLSFLSKSLPIALTLSVVALSRTRGAGERGAMAWGVGIAVAVLLVTEVFNRVFVGNRAEQVLRRLTPTYRLVRWILGPLVPLISPIVRAASEENGDFGVPGDEVSDGEIEAFLDVGAKEGIIEPDEGDLILRVIDFGDSIVKSVMTPRIDMVCAPATTGLDDLIGLFLESRHSRIPLYVDSVDDIRGVLHIRDVLAASQEHRPPAPRSLAREAFIVPETKPLTELLREMQAGHHQMAIVVEEYGGTAGLVTVEDLVEEIVGEIVDEHEEGEVGAKQLEGGGWRLEGMTSLDAVEDLFDVELDDEPYETVGGLIFGYLGDLPEVGATIEAHGLRFVVEKVGERRVDRLRIERVADSGASSGAQEAR
ncbi:MAG: HlyC/CorC family transporter [Acidobacteria bacterium]|nr:HlyC/CorC family transporter [Acidobacteriota bacterium]